MSFQIVKILFLFAKNRPPKKAGLFCACKNIAKKSNKIITVSILIVAVSILIVAASIFHF